MKTNLGNVMIVAAIINIIMTGNDWLNQYIDKKKIQMTTYARKEADLKKIIIIVLFLKR